MVRLMSNMGAGKGNHDTESEAVNGGKEILVVHDNGPQGRSINGRSVFPSALSNLFHCSQSLISLTVWERREKDSIGLNRIFIL